MGEFMVLDLYHTREWKVLSHELFSICGRAHLFCPSYHYYLVEMTGTFVTVVRHISYPTASVLVFKFQKGEWCQINDIGDSCLFLGSNQSICLSPLPRGFPSNSIYFTDDHFLFPINCVDIFTGHDMLVYSMENKTFNPFFERVSISPLPPPLCVTLNST